MEDFYVLLGVEKNASAQEIKKAYRNKARELHPDANQGDAEMEEKFKAVSVAYEVLSDPEKRAIYDQYGVDGLRGGGGYGNSQAGGSFDFNLSDLFESFFGGGAGVGFGGGAQSNSNDAGVQVNIDLKDACFGIAKEVELRMDQTCEVCSGSGAKENTQPITCGTCEGSGIIQQVRQSLFGNMMTQQYCPTCEGMGTLISDPCASCAGHGVVKKDVNLEINIPAGVDNGSRLKIAGQGPAGFRNTGTGDLYVSINVKPDARFERHGDDLVCVQEITFLEAIFGANKELDTFDGIQEFTIPGGTKSGEVFKLRGHGMGKLRSGRRGDLLVYVNVIIPPAKSLSDEQKDILKQYAVASGEEIIEPEHTGLFEKVKRVFS